MVIGRRHKAAEMEEAKGSPSHTPDGRYFIIRGRLWRLSNPGLTEERRQELVKQLMDARRGLRGHPSAAQRAQLRRLVDEAKRGLGERGPVWWTDGAPDYNRRLAKNTPYADWARDLERD